MQADGFRIFLASPGGLDDYRRAAREQFEHIRLTIASPRRIDFDPIGWEDIPPGFGRPQSLINPKLDECNVLVGILGKQLGTPTGEAVSGFVEEYERMAARAGKGEHVAIWIYTLRLAAEDLADPGDKLKAVLAFRERLYKEALVKEFRNVDDFAMQLYRDLISLVANADERRRERGESGASAEPEEARPVPKQGRSDEAGSQLHELLAEAADAAPSLPERFREQRFPLARLALWLSTWEGWYFTNETFGVHQLNRIYVMRAEAVLSPLETRHVLRSLCAHRGVAPGWALLGYDNDRAAPELLMLATGDADDAVRIGAFEMLEPEPINEWLAREDVQLDRRLVFSRLCEQVDELSDAVRAAMIAFAERMGDREARDFLASLADRDSTKRQAMNALIRSRAAEEPERALELAARTDIDLDDGTIAAVRVTASEAALAELERLAVARDERLRIVAVQLLARRGTDAGPTLVARLDDPADDVALAAFMGLCELSDPDTDLTAVYTKVIEREDLKFDDGLRMALDRTRDTRALRDLVNWLEIGTASAYQVLAEERWDAFQDTVRRDLADRFKAFAEESRARVTESFDPEVMKQIENGGKALAAVRDGILKAIDPKIVQQFRDFLAGSDWNDRRFALAALAGVSRNGQAEDARLARPWLDSEYLEVREAAALALARTGTEDDVGKLLELSQSHGGEVFERAALSLSPGPSGAAVALLDSSRAATSVLGARHLYSHASELPDKTLEVLIHHTSEEVRRVGVACALARYKEGDVEHLLNRYAGARSYYYNVVFWLDRALHAPAYLRERTRVELAAFAAEHRSPELPRGSTRARRRLLGQLMRSRASA